MSNKRTLIRHAFRDFILTKVPPGIFVSASRHRILGLEDLPLVNVTSGTEDAEFLNESPRMYRRRLEIAIEIYVRAKENIEDAVEALMILIETYINQEDLFTLKGQVSEIVYKGSVVSPDGREATQESAVAVIRYEVIYYTNAGKIADEEPDFDEIYANISDLIDTEITNIQQ